MQANYNFTNKQEIKANTFEIEYTDNDDLKLKQLVFHLRKKLKVSHNEKLVIEVDGTSEYERIEAENNSEKQVFNLENFLFDEKDPTRNRLIVVSTEDDKKGLILFSSKEKKQTTRRRGKGKKSDNEKDINIFNPERSSKIGEQIWAINWEGDNPEVLINSRLEVNNLQQNKIFMGLMLPGVAKSILTDALVKYKNFDEIEDPRAGDWFLWAQQYKKMPDGDFNNDPEGWLEWIDEVLKEFCDDTRFENNETFLDKVVGEING